MPSGDARALKISGWLTGIYFIVELIIGIRSGSVAVISDAFHTFSAVGGVLIALVAGYYAKRPASQYSSFGLIRAEIVGALFNGLFLLGMAFLVLLMGTMRLRNPIEVPTGLMLLAAGGGLVTEVISLWLLYRRQKGNLNMKGAFWHIIQTFIGSLIIIVAALVIRFTGFYAIDPILGMAFGLVLFWASWGIIREATRILLDIVPKDLDLQSIVGAVEELEPVQDVHHAHAWALTTGKNIVSMHVRVNEFKNQENLLHEIHQLLRNRFSVYFSTIQIETECFEDSEAVEIDFRGAQPKA
jgi:cobalt-zinc-cadmium efflux system protein